MKNALGFIGFVIGVAVANVLLESACNPRPPHFVFDGAPGLVVQVDDAPPRTRDGGVAP